MSNDWWTSSTSSSTFHTPQRPGAGLVHSTSSNALSSSRTRFAPHNSTSNYGHGHGHGNANDQLDPEDERMAEQIKFLPSFASSPAGKLALGTSPSQSTAGMGFGSGMSGGLMGATGAGSGGGGAGGGAGGAGGMGVSSPGEGRRSPTVGARFSNSVQERDSPRHHRRSLIHQPNSFGTGSAYNAGFGGAGSAMDEDMPPTASLRDSTTDQGVRSADVAAPVELPTPQSLIPSSTTTTLHVFGPPADVLPTLKSYLAQFGPVESYKPGPEGSNWWIVNYGNPVSASYALRRHGEIINGRWMVGFKVAGEGSTAGCTLVPGGQGQAGQASNQVQNRGNGAGTPIRVQSGSIIKPKANNTTQPIARAAGTVTNAGSGNDYAWDEPENQGGWGNWVSERLVSKAEKLLSSL
ncbi:hypothetical protein I317_06523 [Kwoniella heveanensis CBS 569]|uniref:RRM Nup35-type domain-containing protein n=1 Tax=Kwoniella heveanensis BCC8398 TaxID=1296120 RepID=A0A1B9GTI6_9TREE|nr:hypothetical protein I316_03896 [Kwoniella heveanensis BCC8398]OCF39668.1 hypothetical protein I317_06523 [Kwoniella heveanensis CBS 569]